MTSQMQTLIANIRSIAFDLRSVKVPRIVGAIVKDQTDHRFDTKEGPDGRRWRAWSGTYARTRKGGDSLLIDNSTHESGPHLSDSIELHVTPAQIVVGTAVEYGAPNQETRPFLGLSAGNVSEIEQRLIDVFRGWT